MSAGDPGTIYSEDLHAWIMDPNYVPPKRERSPLEWLTTPGVCIGTGRIIAAGTKPRGTSTSAARNIDKMADRERDLLNHTKFWMSIPLIGGWVVGSFLARRLEKLTDELESVIGKNT